MFYSLQIIPFLRGNWFKTLLASVNCIQYFKNTLLAKFFKFIQCITVIVTLLATIAIYILEVLASFESLLPAYDVDLIQSKEKNDIKFSCDGAHGDKKLHRVCEKPRAVLWIHVENLVLKSGLHLIKRSERKNTYLVNWVVLDQLRALQFITML